MYRRRDIEKILLKAAESFQVITLFGSRQVGKTTTAEHLFGDKFSFVSLDDSDELALAHNNPKAFFESHPWPLIIDEVQKEVGLLSEIKRTVINMAGFTQMEKRDIEGSLFEVNFESSLNKQRAHPGFYKAVLRYLRISFKAECRTYVPANRKEIRITRHMSIHI